MNVQLIHRSQAPATVSWFLEFHRTRVDRIATLTAFLVELTREYGPVGGGLRTFQTVMGLIGGFTPLSDIEPAPRGWVRNTVWEGFIPDIGTPVGKIWQSRIDNLPSAIEPIDPTAVGIPNSTFITHEDGSVTGHVPTFHMSADQATVYATWDVRSALQPLELAIATSDPEGKFGWTEMPRSSWYTRVELEEAIANMELSQGLR